MAKSSRVKSGKIRAAALALLKERPAALVVVAHPDDAEIYFGATMIRLAARGARVFIVVATNGEKRGDNPRASSASVARIRRKEQLEAARLAGVRGVFFLDLPDGGLEARKPRLRERITYFIRKLQPRRLYTFDSSLPYAVGSGPYGLINHPDHRAVGDAALAAAHGCSGLARYYPRHRRQGALPWSVREIFLSGAPFPNYRFDVRPYLSRKKALLSVYKSQAADTFQAGALREEKAFRRLDLSRRGP